MRLPAFFAASTGIAASIGFGQPDRSEVMSRNHSHIIEITLPRDVTSETVLIRYALEGDDLGGWVEPRKGVSS